MPRTADYLRMAWVILCLSLAILLTLLASPARAITSASIGIDGDLSDWAGVRLDPSNSVGDTVIPDDPDYPGQPDRDVYLTSVTYDADYLYFAWRRTASGTKAITFGAYLDMNCDGVLKDGDKVVSWVVSTGQPYADAHAPSPSAWIFLYNQARTKVGNNITILNPGGDSMGWDGNTPDGWADIQSGQILPARPMDAWFAPNGIEAEGRVAWSDLGVPAGTPIGIHIASGNGNAWGTRYAPSTTWKWTGSPPQYLEENRGQVEDNAGGISLAARSVLVAPNSIAGATAGTWVTYTHTITNSGNVADVFDLTATSSRQWTTALARPGGAAVSAVSLAFAGNDNGRRARVRTRRHCRRDNRRPDGSGNLAHRRLGHGVRHRHDHRGQRRGHALSDRLDSPRSIHPLLVRRAEQLRRYGDVRSDVVLDAGIRPADRDGVGRADEHRATRFR